MAKYLVSFPGSAMDISDEDMAAVGEAAHAVMREAKDAGVYVFGGGINEGVAPLMVAADGTVTNETYPQTKELDGGFCVLELPSRERSSSRLLQRRPRSLMPIPPIRTPRSLVGATGKHQW
jgi:hypothetical protein